MRVQLLNLKVQLSLCNQFKLSDGQEIVTVMSTTMSKKWIMNKNLRAVNQTMRWMRLKRKKTGDKQLSLHSKSE